jgi:hypothetical protein
MIHRVRSLLFPTMALLVGCNMDTHMYDDDPSHSIPRVGVIDAVLETDQGLRYGLVIATPLDSSDRSLSRLKRKCDGYLADFRSAETQANLAKRGRGEKYIYVYIHPASSSEARAEIALCKSRAESDGIKFLVTESLPGIAQ